MRGLNAIKSADRPSGLVSALFVLYTISQQGNFFDAALLLFAALYLLISVLLTPRNAR